MQVEVRAQNMELGGQKTGAMEHETWGTVCSMSFGGRGKGMEGGDWAGKKP